MTHEDDESTHPDYRRHGEAVRVSDAVRKLEARERKRTVHLTALTAASVLMAVAVLLLVFEVRDTREEGRIRAAVLDRVERNEQTVGCIVREIGRTFTSGVHVLLAGADGLDGDERARLRQDLRFHQANLERVIEASVAGPIGECPPAHEGEGEGEGKGE